MATIKFFLYSKTKGKLAPIHCRLVAGRGKDLIEKTGKFIDPGYWNPAKNRRPAAIKQIVYNEDEEGRKLQKEHQGIKEHLKKLESFIERELNKPNGPLTKEWLTEVVYRFINKKSSDAESLMEYIERFIKEAEAGKRKNENMMNFSVGTITNFKAFKNQLTNYQAKRSKELNRPITVDFADVDIDFYNDFVSYLSDEGFAQNTIGKHIKTLKAFMSKSLEEKLHTNRDFQFRSFKGISRKSFNIYLSEAELDTLYKHDLSDNPDFDKARDAFMVLCETGLRISDYKDVDVSIKTNGGGRKLIHLTQTKTDGEVVIPVSTRLDAILQKYGGTLPKLPDQYINRDIKKIAEACKINDPIRWTEKKLGKSYDKTALKWEKISCHTGRRTFCTNAYLAGIPTISIMKISGHSTEANFLKYIKISKEENATILASHPFFNKLAIAK